ncbi:hypothetical protein HDU92_004338 [Lobulomyces angularis]|nr:hypothetical protein HDU92_004338 [Lobulomyces angularis]
MELYHGDGPYTPPTPSNPTIDSDYVNNPAVDDMSKNNAPALNSATKYFSLLLLLQDQEVKTLKI